MPAQASSQQTLQSVHVIQKETNPITSHTRLEGKIAIVTGGARGIGEATVRLFAKHGAKVIIADINEIQGSSLATSLSPNVTFVRCDVTLERDIENVINSTVARFGKLDVLFNNAGVLGNQRKNRKSIVDFDADEFDRVMRVNVRGSLLGIKHAARAMIARGCTAGGCIISTASVAGVVGGMGPHAYTASKHAIVGMTKNAACELGRYGIRVNCLSPFGVATSMLVKAWREDDGEDDDDDDDDEEMAPSGKEVEKMEEFVRGMANLKGATLRPKDVAEAALYLASDESKYVSGHNLVVDGGVTTATNCVGL